MLVGGMSIFGAGLSVAAASFFAIQYLCVRLGTANGSVRDAVFITLLANVFIVVPLTGLLYGIPNISRWAILWFSLAGLAGSFAARLTMFKSVQLIGASRTSPIVASNVFFATLLAVFIFNEQLTLWHAGGIVLIVVGVTFISIETTQDARIEESLWDIGLTLVLPVIAALFLAIEPIFITLGLEEGTAVLPGVAIKVVAATIGFVIYLVLIDDYRAIDPNFEASIHWYIAAGITSTLGLLCLFAALAVAPVVVVVPLLQIVPLLVLVLSAIFLPKRIERVTWQLFAAAVVVALGAIIVSLH